MEIFPEIYNQAYFMKLRVYVSFLVSTLRSDSYDMMNHYLFSLTLSDFVKGWTQISAWASPGKEVIGKNNSLLFHLFPVTVAGNSWKTRLSGNFAFSE